MGKPTRIPPSVKAVAILYVLVGGLVAINLVRYLLRADISSGVVLFGIAILNVGGAGFCVIMGIGLLSGQWRFRARALVLASLGMVGIPVFFVTCMFFRMFGYHALRLLAGCGWVWPRTVVFALIVAFPLSCWQYWVLRRPRVCEFFGVQPPAPKSRRARRITVAVIVSAVVLVGALLSYGVWRGHRQAGWVSDRGRYHIMVRELRQYALDAGTYPADPAPLIKELESPRMLAHGYIYLGDAIKTPSACLPNSRARGEVLPPADLHSLPLFVERRPRVGGDRFVAYEDSIAAMIGEQQLRSCFAELFRAFQEGRLRRVRPAYFERIERELGIELRGSSEP